MGSGADARQIELELGTEVRSSKLPEANREQVVELLGQLLRAVAKAERDGGEADNER
jgi:hypothetical protein